MIVGIIGLIIFAVFRFLKPNLKDNFQSFRNNIASEEPITHPRSPSYQSLNEERVNNYDNSRSSSGSFSQDSTQIDSFLQEAKVLFVRLQAANDTNNLKDIQEFTTPELFAHIKLQMNDRKEKNVTDVIRLDAELLDDKYPLDEMKSVLFFGTLREAENEPVTTFKEIWHFEKNFNSVWVVAGIEQTTGK